MTGGDFLNCPLPLDRPSKVTMAHGGGGRIMRQLIQDLFGRTFAGPALETEHDSAVVPFPDGRLAFTTDSYVVRPLFFPGGDIGRLAVFGTVNDLAMSGARPLYLSVGFILEEGFPLADLERVALSIRSAADRCGIQVVTGDTKVVEHGKGDGVFLNTSGVGVVDPILDIRPGRVRPGDRVLVSGDLGRHGIAVMAAREGLDFETTVQSDLSPLHELVGGLVESGVEVHCLRDLTRGGLASALNEIALKSGTAIHIEESRVRVIDEVQGACEMLGLDPLYVANEGRLVAIVRERDADRALAIMREFGGPHGGYAGVVGEVIERPGGRVVLKGALGVDRILDLLSGEQLPRIC